MSPRLREVVKLSLSSASAAVNETTVTTAFGYCK